MEYHGMYLDRPLRMPLYSQVMQVKGDGVTREKLGSLAVMRIDGRLGLERALDVAREHLKREQRGESARTAYPTVAAVVIKGGRPVGYVTSPGADA